MNDISNFTGWCIALGIPAALFGAIWISIYPPNLKEGTAEWLLIGLVRIVLWPLIFILQLVGMCSVVSTAHDFIKRK